MVKGNEKVKKYAEQVVKIMTDKSIFHGCKCGERSLCIKPDIREIRNCKNYEKFRELNPLIELLFDEDKTIQFTTIPILFPNTSYLEIADNFSHLNHMVNMHRRTPGVAPILEATLYDYSMRNLFFLKSQPRETLIDIFNIKDSLLFDENRDFYQKHHFDPNIWITAFRSVLQKKKETPPKVKILEGKIDKKNLRVKFNLNPAKEISEIMESIPNK